MSVPPPAPERDTLPPSDLEEPTDPRMSWPHGMTAPEDVEAWIAGLEGT